MSCNKHFPFYPNILSKWLRLTTAIDLHGNISTWRSRHFSLVLWEVTVCVSFSVKVFSICPLVSTSKYSDCCTFESLSVSPSSKLLFVSKAACEFCDWHPQTLCLFSSYLRPVTFEREKISCSLCLQRACVTQRCRRWGGRTQHADNSGL